MTLPTSLQRPSLEEEEEGVAPPIESRFLLWQFAFLSILFSSLLTPTGSPGACVCLCPKFVALTFAGSQGKTIAVGFLSPCLAIVDLSCDSGQFLFIRQSKSILRIRRVPRDWG